MTAAATTTTTMLGLRMLRTPATAWSAAGAVPRITASLTLPRLPSLSQLLFPAILWAVPKSKISHSRKRMRASNKALKNREDITSCPCCGSPVLLHHGCLTCYKHIRQGPQTLFKLKPKASATDAVTETAKSE